MSCSDAEAVSTFSPVGRILGSVDTRLLACQPHPPLTAVHTARGVRGGTAHSTVVAVRLTCAGDPSTGKDEFGDKPQIIYLSLHCHHQNDSCLKMGSDESHFKVSLTVRDKVTKDSVHRRQLLKKKESRSGFEPRSLCLLA